MSERGPLRMLHVEDDPDDAFVVHRELRRAGFDLHCRRVDTGPALLEALQSDTWDIVLTDYAMPEFSGLQAIALVQEQMLDLPVIVVSGTIGEDSAVEAMRCGAADYLLKDKLARLGAAVEREVIEAGRRARKRATEAALLRSEQTNRALLAALPDRILRLDRDGRVQGSVGGGVSGASIREIVPDDAVATCLRQIARTLETRSVQQLEYEATVEGEVRHYELRLAPVGDGTVLGILRDLTEQRRAEEQLRAAVRMEAIGRLAGGVAHDFNNVLNVIISFSELAAHALPEDHRARPMLQEVVDAGWRAAQLVAQLLSYSRQRRLSPQQVDVDGMLTTIASMLDRALGDDVRLVLDLGGDLHPVVVDTSAFESVLMNLAVNARDAMPDGGTLTIRTRNQGESQVAVDVIDTGTGITPETLDRMFEPFFTTKPEGKGTGLGLATCRGLVQQAGGTIEVDSEVGRGTRFRVLLPRCTQQTLTVTPSPAPSADGAAGRDRVVLVVDDRDPVRRAMVKALQSQGYEVLQASDGPEALRVASEHDGPLDLLVADVVMPGMSGPELGATLQSERPGVKTLYVTGHARVGVPPGPHLLHKPFGPAELGRAVRGALAAPPTEAPSGSGPASTGPAAAPPPRTG